jgi:hypothetical protein
MLHARKASMLANSSTFVTETMSEATKRTTDNAEVQRCSTGSRCRTAMPRLEPPGPAIGMLRKLLPHPEEWGFAGYDNNGLPLLPDQSARPKTLLAPEKPDCGE